MNSIGMKEKSFPILKRISFPSLKKELLSLLKHGWVLRGVQQNIMIDFTTYNK